MEQFREITAADFTRPGGPLNLLEELPDGIVIARISAGRARLLYVTRPSSS